MSNRPNGDSTSILARVKKEPDATEEAARHSGLRGASTAHTRLPPPTIQGYQILEEIHRGGQGVVYRAIRLSDRRLVALKVVLEGEFAGEVTLRRFQREVELAASLHHPNIVNILDSGLSDGRYFLAMEFIDGQRFDQFIRKEKLRIGELLLKFVIVCDAVNYAHQRGVIHRDLKPSNILVDAAGEPHILDFGLAKSEGSSSPHETTVELLSLTGQVVGTLAYMSPEQASGTMEVDLRTDVYSLGVVLYELLVGRAPYRVDGPLGEVLQRIAHDDPFSPRSLRSIAPYGRYLDDELSTILLRALEKDPARRYQTAGDLARDIQLYLTGQPIEAKRASGLYLFRKTLKRYKMQAIFAGVILAVMIGALAMYAGLYTNESEARRQADTLQYISFQKAEEEKLAGARERELRADAERATESAQQAAAELREALTQQIVQRGELALERGDLAEAGDRFWQAFLSAPQSAAPRWGLRQFYLQTGLAGAVQSFGRGGAPCSVSRAAKYMAVVEVPESITVRDAASGATCAWLTTPGPVSALRMDDEGGVLAAGADWVRIWKLPDERPIACIDGPAEPQSLYLGDDAATVLVITPGSVIRYDRASGLSLGETQLCGRFRSGVASSTLQAGSPSLPARLALVTTAGLEIVRLEPKAPAVAELYLENAPPRAVHFTSAGALLVLSEDLAEFDPASGLKPLASSARAWGLIASGAGDMTALGAVGGNVTVLRDGVLQPVRQVAGRLVELLLSDSTLITFDDRGTLARWPASQVAPFQQPLFDAPVLAMTTDDAGVAFALLHDLRLMRVAPGAARAEVIAELPAPNGSAAKAEMRAELGVSADGHRVAVRVGSRCWIVEHASEAERRVQPLSSAGLEHIAISTDGQWLAGLRSAGADVDLIAWRLVESPTEIPLGRFAASSTRDLDFIPGTQTLLIARANGRLATFDLSVPRPVLQDALVPLHSAATNLAIDARAGLMAASSEDGAIRICTLGDGTELGHLHTRSPVSAMQFAVDGKSVLVSTGDGGVGVYAVPTFMALATLPAAENAPGLPPHAAWSGPNVIITSPRGAALWSMDLIDQRIDAQTPFASQRQIAKQLQINELYDAWAAASALQDMYPQPGREAREAVLEQALRREHWDLPGDWQLPAPESLDRRTALRLGQACFAGGRFEPAERLLRRYATLADARDEDVARRLADCRYLLNDPNAAIAIWQDQLGTQTLLYRNRACVSMKTIVALHTVGRTAEADAARRAFEQTQTATDRQRECKAATLAILSAVLNDSLGTEPLRLDPAAQANPEALNCAEFFRGELARARGDLTAARLHFQRCNETDGEHWPATWARFRLRQISPQDF